MKPFPVTENTRIGYSIFEIDHTNYFLSELNSQGKDILRQIGIRFDNPNDYWWEMPLFNPLYDLIIGTNITQKPQETVVKYFDSVGEPVRIVFRTFFLYENKIGLVFHIFSSISMESFFHFYCFFENTPHIIVDYDEKIILSVNPSAVQLLQYSPEEFIGMSLNRLESKNKNEIAEQYNTVPGTYKFSFNSFYRKKNDKFLSLKVTGMKLNIETDSILILSYEERNEPIPLYPSSSESNGNFLIPHNIRDIVIGTDKKYRCLFANNAAMDFFDLNPDQYLGTDVEKLISEKINVDLKENSLRIPDSGQTILMKTLDIDDEVLTFELDIYSTLNGYIISIRDVTQDRKLTEELMSTNRFLQTLSKCSEIIVYAKDVNDMLTKICNTMVDVGKYPLAWFGFEDNGIRTLIKPNLRSYRQMKCMDSFLNHKDSEELCYFSTFYDQKISRQSSSDGFGSNLSREMFPEFGSCLSLPIHPDDSWKGFFMITYRKDTDIDQKEINLLLELTSNIAYGIKNKRLEKEKELTDKQLMTRLKYEEALENCSRILLQNISNVLEKALESLLNATGANRAYIFKNVDDPKYGLSVLQAHEVRLPGYPIPENFSKSRRYPYRIGFRRWEKLLSEGKAITGLVKFFPRTEQKFLRSQNILSLLVIPLMVNNRWYGFIGFDDTDSERLWNIDDIKLLQTASEMIGNYLEREQLSSSLKESEERYRVFMDQSSEAIFILDNQLNMLELNHRAKELLGFTIDDYNHIDLGNLVFREQIGYVEKMLYELQTKGTASLKRIKVLQKNSHPIVVDITVKFIDIGHTQFVHTVAHDVTPETEIEEKLLKYQKQLRDLASDLILTEERERRRLAIELHDTIVQNLAISKINLGILKKKITQHEIMDNIDKIYRMIDLSITQSRSLMSEMSPHSLFELGFSAGIQWLIDEIKDKHGLNIRSHIELNHYEPSQDNAILLYQSVRELLLNIIKHADTDTAELLISIRGNQLQIEVNDRGKGFDSAKLPVPSHRGGFGLFSIRERLSIIGGKLNIQSEPGEGTEVVMTIPVQTDIEEPEEVYYDFENDPRR